MNYSFMYGYFVGDIIPTLYKDWKKYDSDPDEIFKLLVKQGYPEYHAQFMTQELLSTPPSIDIQINDLKEVDITPEVKIVMNSDTEELKYERQQEFVKDKSSQLHCESTLEGRHGHLKASIGGNVESWQMTEGIYEEPVRYRIKLCQEESRDYRSLQPDLTLDDLKVEGQQKFMKPIYCQVELHPDDIILKGIGFK